MVEAEPIVTQLCRPSIDAAPTASPFHDQKNAPPCVHEKRFPRCHPGFSETPPGPTRSASPHLERKIHACRKARECISALWGEHSIANPQVDVDLQKNSENPLTSRALRTTLLHLYSVMYIYSPRTKCSRLARTFHVKRRAFPFRLSGSSATIGDCASHPLRITLWPCRSLNQQPPMTMPRGWPQFEQGRL